MVTPATRAAAGIASPRAREETSRGGRPGANTSPDWARTSTPYEAARPIEQRYLQAFRPISLLAPFATPLVESSPMQASIRCGVPPRRPHRPAPTHPWHPESPACVPPARADLAFGAPRREAATRPLPPGVGPRRPAVRA